MLLPTKAPKQTAWLRVSPDGAGAGEGLRYRVELERSTGANNGIISQIGSRSGFLFTGWLDDSASGVGQSRPFLHSGRTAQGDVIGWNARRCDAFELTQNPNAAGVLVGGQMLTPAETHCDGMPNEPALAEWAAANPGSDYFEAIDVVPSTTGFYLYKIYRVHESGSEDATPWTTFNGVYIDGYPGPYASPVCHSPAARCADCALY